MATRFLGLILLAVFFVGIAASAQAQTTSFTYQGRLTDGGTPANGNYDLQFVLWDSLSGGTQIGTTQTSSNVSVSSGVFSVSLDFGGAAFPGANRFLEISTRLAGGGSFTLLTPREQVTSTPYAVRSSNATLADTATTATSATTASNATQLGGVAAGQYVQTTDARLTDSRTPTAGSTSYVQNGTSAQASSNFNISGNGIVGGNFSANSVDSLGYFYAGHLVLSGLGVGNIFVGMGAGAGGGNNSFFGANAGSGNNTGANNSFFGKSAGTSNTIGGSNSFFGDGAGNGNNTGTGNSFFGLLAGNTNTTGSSNSVFGTNADVGSNNLTNATAIGTDARVDQSNSLVLGSIKNLNFATADTNVGIGTTTPGFRLDVAGEINTSTQYDIGGSRVLSIPGCDNVFVGQGTASVQNLFCDNSFFGSLAGNVNTAAGNSYFGSHAGNLNSTGSENSFFGVSSGSKNKTGTRNTTIGHTANFGSDNLSNATAIGAFAQVDQNNSLVLGSINGVNTATADTNVGIGTTTPGQALTIQRNAGVFIDVKANNGTQELFVGADGNGGIISTFSNHDLVLRAGGNSDKVRIKANGNVGIGTAAPNAKLQVVGGNVYITTPNSLIITSPNGACWQLTVNNAGALTSISVTCP
jgi:hypothetical protein